MLLESSQYTPVAQSSPIPYHVVPEQKTRLLLCLPTYNFNCFARWKFLSKYQTPRIVSLVGNVFPTKLNSRKLYILHIFQSNWSCPCCKWVHFLEPLGDWLHSSRSEKLTIELNQFYLVPSCLFFVRPGYWVCSMSEA